MLITSRGWRESPLRRSVRGTGIPLQLPTVAGTYIRRLAFFQNKTIF